MNGRHPAGGRPVYLPRLLSKWGACSRRTAEERVAAGRVTVNGRVQRDVLFEVDPARDEIRLDGKPVAPAPFRYAVMHKPAGVVTTARDEHGRASVLDLVPESLRGVMPVGRLDRDSSGLLLLTNDHDLGNAVAGAGRGPRKLYHVEVAGAAADAALAPMRAGIVLDGRRCLPAEVRILAIRDGATLLEIGLHEGRNRQIRRSLGALGLPVQTLIRVAIGPLQLGDLAPGAVRELTAAEVAELRRACRP